MKYYHFPTERNKLTMATVPHDNVIHTEQGIFKIRKNGRVIIVIDTGKENEETLRVTPLQRFK